MKLRMGFVSNSSSSSFIVDMTELSKIDNDTEKGILKLISRLGPTVEVGEDSLPVDTVAKNIAKSLSESGKATEEDLLNLLRGYNFNYNDLDRKMKNQFGIGRWQTENADVIREMNQFEKEYLDALAMKNYAKLIQKGHEYRIISYADDTREGNVMEHGDHWNLMGKIVLEVNRH